MNTPSSITVIAAILKEGGEGEGQKPCVCVCTYVDVEIS